jgi:hypothetical protein
MYPCIPAEVCDQCIRNFGATGQIVDLFEEGVASSFEPFGSKFKSKRDFKETLLERVRATLSTNGVSPRA